MIIPSIKSLMTVVICTALLLVAGILNNRLTHDSALHQFPMAATQGGQATPLTTDALSKAIPPVARAHLASVFLGGFRGLIVDGLWLRAALLQEQGRMLELIQLANWITSLEPEYPQVWALQAWNMAYNVSVLMPTPAERWQWIQLALSLLRDRGIPATGGAPAIYREIAQLFLHKIAGGGDDSADSYRIRWLLHAEAHLNRPPRTIHQGDSDRGNALKMNPVRMREIERIYGALDWRIPESQALYWAYGGLSGSPHSQTIACRRIIYQAMTRLFESGTLTIDPTAGVVVQSAQFELLPAVRYAFEAALPDDPVAAAAYAGFLKRATRHLATFGRFDDARACFGVLETRFPDAEVNRGFDTFTQNPLPIMPKIITIETF